MNTAHAFLKLLFPPPPPSAGHVMHWVKEWATSSHNNEELNTSTAGLPDWHPNSYCSSPVVSPQWDKALAKYEAKLITCNMECPAQIAVMISSPTPRTQYAQTQQTTVADKNTVSGGMQFLPEVKHSIWNCFAIISSFRVNGTYTASSPCNRPALFRHELWSLHWY